MSAGATVWYTRCPVPTAFSIAVELGTLEERLGAEGVAFRSLSQTADPGLRRAHFTQNAPGLVRHGGNIPVLAARARGADVRVVGLSWTRFYEPILVRPDSGLERTEDLRGRRIGVPRRTDVETDFWRPAVLRGFAQGLASVGLGLDDVEIVDIPIDRTFLAGKHLAAGTRAPLWDAHFMIGQQREEALALLGGQVDAIFSHAVLAVNVQGFTGARTLVDVGALDDPDLRVNNGTPQVLTVTGDLLDEHPDIVVRILTETIHGADWARRNPDAARAVVAREAGLAPQLLDIAHPGGVAGELGIGLEPELVARLESQARFLADHGLIDRPVSVDELVAPEPLDRALRSLAAVA